MLLMCTLHSNVQYLHLSYFLSRGAFTGCNLCMYTQIFGLC